MIPTSTDSKQEEMDQTVVRRKKQIWLIAAIMTGSFCIGTTALFFIIWLLLR